MRLNSNDDGTASIGVSRLPSSEDVRSIGSIIRDTRNLTAEQVGQILEYQRRNGVKFGEAAIALGMATPEDILQALAQQFNYAYGTEDRRANCPELISLNQPFGVQAESVRAIRSQIMLRTQSEHEGAPKARRALAVVSQNPGDGKTFFCANLAVSLAQLGERTLVIDADLRGPRLHEVFGEEPTTGLVGLLSGRQGDRVIRAVTGVPNLFILPAGISPPNPLELVQGPPFGLLLHELLSKFDHVIVDTPAGEYGTDGAVIAARCGTSLLIARKDRSAVADIQDLLQTLNAAHSKVVGVVMNDF
jgi:chain length determinant protein tyrosine kinase EpsG